jgi:transcriptional regulator NrdR family protein
MKCPECKSKKTKVIETRPMGEERIRIRVCLFCKKEFKTYEKAEG